MVVDSSGRADLNGLVAIVFDNFAVAAAVVGTTAVAADGDFAVVAAVPTMTAGDRQDSQGLEG